MTELWDDGAPVEEEELPDVSGMTPVRRPLAAAERVTPVVALRKGWGYDAFRPLQSEAIAAALAQRDSLVVLPTGGGKSLCYQIPAACGAGLVLVVSPLIALMDDQVAGAREAGLSAGALHSHVTPAERTRVREALRDGTLQVLYASPERLCVGDLLAELGGRLALIAVDEAHCVSHWGHDFRPEYRRLAPIFARAAGVPRMALTATATPQVQDDIVAQLGLRSPQRLIGHVDRPNLTYRVLPRHDQSKQVIEAVTRHAGEGGIVYAQTRREVERLADKLLKSGVSCAAYHAGLDKVVRAKAQHDFVNERIDVVVATVAFGMGIDRSNVRYVVHANCPKSVEHYQQEAGRAGRDGDSAECVLLFSAGDLATHRSLALGDGPLPADRRQALERQLRDIGRYASAPVCRHRLFCEHFGQTWPPPGAATAMDQCGACDVCLGETGSLPDAEALVTAQKIISCAWRLEGRWGIGQSRDVLLGKATDKVTRAGHDRLSVFGILRDAGEASLSTWIDQLIVQGFLAQVEEDGFPRLTMTDEGRQLCRGGGAVRLAQPMVTAKQAKKATRKAATEAAASAAPGDAGLFARLRTLRRLLAEAHGVPPYLVFPDTTLRGIAAAKPTTPTALRAVKGVGDAKLARWGKPFLRVVAGAAPESVAGAASVEEGQSPSSLVEEAN